MKNKTMEKKYSAMPSSSSDLFFCYMSAEVVACFEWQHISVRRILQLLLATCSLMASINESDCLMTLQQHTK